MDSLTKQFMAKVIQEKLEFAIVLFQLEGWSVLYKDSKLSQLNLSEMYNWLTEKQSLAYWIMKGDITPAIARSTIDWSTLCLAMNHVPQSRRQWVSKHPCGFCAVGKMQKILRKQIHDHCPQCRETEE
jgi:hypothetical protein